MDSTEFNKFAKETIQIISDGIESSDKDYKLDVDFSSGKLTVEIDDDKDLIIRKKKNASVILLESPVSGTHEFLYNELKKEWLNDNDNELFNQVKEEIKSLTAIDIEY